LSKYWYSNAYAKKNKELFTSDGLFDENAFQRTRNLLGMVLLLNDKQNLSSNDEVYRNKLKTYSKSNLVWNELLAGHLHSTDFQKIPPRLQVHKIEPTESGVFPLDKIEQRQKAVFSVIKDIWASG